MKKMKKKMRMKTENNEGKREKNVKETAPETHNSKHQEDCRDYRCHVTIS